MTPGKLLSVSGLVLVVGALLTVLMAIINALFYSNPNPTQLTMSPSWLIVNLLMAIGVTLILLSLPALYLRQAEATGWMGLAGYICIFLGGLILGVFTSLLSAVVAPYLAQHAPKLLADNGPPALNAATMIGAILLGVGGLLFGYATLRARILPNGAAYLLIAGAILTLLTLLPLPGLAGMLLGQLSQVVFVLALAWLGYALWAEGRGLPVPGLRLGLGAAR